MSEDPTQGEPIAESPAATAEPTASAAEPQPTGDPANQPEAGGKKEWMVPGERLQDVTDELKRTREELEGIKTSFASIGKSEPESEELNPEADKMLQNWAKQRGFVTAAELAESKAEIQAQTDLRDLQAKYSDFDADKVVRFALDNMGVKNKEALESAYFYMNRDKIIEEAKKAALAEAGSPTVTAEVPGPGSGKAPETAASNAPREIKDRIRAAREKLATS